MTITLSVTWLDPSGKNEKLASFTYAPPPGKPDASSLQLTDAQVSIPGAEPLALKSNFEPGHCNFSVAGFQKGQQLFLWHCKWDDSAPYFGFRLSCGGFVQLNFKKVETAGVPPKRE